MMILVGDKHIPYEKIAKITTLSDIDNTESNSILLFDFDFEILKYTLSNDLKSAVLVNSIKEIVYASSLEARYIICDIKLAKQAQKIAQNYMFDSKILAIIENSDQIEQIALDEIDGAIYKEIL